MKRQLVIALVLVVALILSANYVSAIYEKYTIIDNNVEQMSNVANLLTYIVQVDDVSNFNTDYNKLLANIFQNSNQAMNITVSHIKAIDAYAVSSWAENTFEYSEFDITDLSQSDKFMNYFLIPAGTSSDRKYALVSELTVDPTVLGKTVTFDPVFKLSQGITIASQLLQTSFQKLLDNAQTAYFFDVGDNDGYEYKYIPPTYVSENGIGKFVTKINYTNVETHVNKLITIDDIVPTGAMLTRTDVYYVGFTQDYIVAEAKGYFDSTPRHTRLLVYSASDASNIINIKMGDDNDRVIAVSETLDKTKLYIVTYNSVSKTFKLFELNIASKTLTQLISMSLQSDAKIFASFSPIEHSVYLYYTQELILLDAKGGVLYVNFLDNVIISYKLKSQITNLAANATSWGLTTLNPATALLYVVNNAGNSYNINVYTLLMNIYNFKLVKAYSLTTVNTNIKMNDYAKQTFLDLISTMNITRPQIPNTTVYITVYDKYNRDVTSDFVISLYSAPDGVKIDGNKIAIPSLYFGQTVTIQLKFTKKNDPSSNFIYTLEVSVDAGVKYISVSTAEYENFKQQQLKNEVSLTSKYNYKFKFITADNKLLRKKLYIVINGTKYELQLGDDGYYHFYTNISLANVSNIKIVDSEGNTIKELSGDTFVWGDSVAYNVLTFNTSKYFVVNYNLDVYIYTGGLMSDDEAWSKIKLSFALAGYFVLDGKLQQAKLNIDALKKKLGAKVYISELDDITNSSHRTYTVTFVIPRGKLATTGTYSIVAEAYFETFNFKKVKVATVITNFDYSTNNKVAMTTLNAKMNINIDNNSQVQKTALVSRLFNSTSFFSIIILIIIAVVTAVLTRNEKITLFITVLVFVILALAGLISETILVLTLILSAVALALKLGSAVTGWGGD